MPKRFRDLKLGVKLMGSLVLVASLSIFTVSYVEYRMVAKAMEAQILEDLVLVADSMEGYVLEFLEGAKKRTVDFSSDGFIRDSTKKIISGEQNISSDLNRHLVVNKMSLDTSIFGISVLNRDGIVVGSTVDGILGEDYSASDSFLVARNLRYGETHLADMDVGHAHFGVDEPHLMVAAPLIEKTTNNLLGVIINHVKIDPLNDVLLGVRQLELGAVSGTKGRRETLEIYLVGKDGIMITESRFIQGAALKQEVDTLPVQKCKSLEEMSGIYPDYRGVSIVGASMCLRNGWTLLAEIDEEEAFSSLAEIRRNVVYLIIFQIILMVLYLIYLSRGIILPIRALSRGVAIISGGDLSHRVEVSSKDEIGKLATSFNEMTEKIKKSHDHINRQKERFKTLLMSIGDGVFGIDKEQKIIYFNQRAEEISGYKADEVMGKQYYDVLKFIKVQDKTENIEFIRKALKGVAAEMADHTVLVRKDKKEIHVADAATPIKDEEGNLSGAIVVFRDATKERELEQAKSELVSFAGHQLKAPLTYLAGNMEMMKGGKCDPETAKLIDETEKGVARMKKLIHDVLNISRIEQGEIKLNPEPVQLEEIVESVIEESSSVAEQRNVNVEFTKSAQPLPEFEADAQQIHEVFKNIISNAIKYTKDSITISFEKKDGNIVFSCSDNGIGIPKDEQSKIFAKFYTASNTSKTETKGTGLGLSIAKALIEKMNGKIWFESEENKGSTFYVSLPFMV